MAPGHLWSALRYVELNPVRARLVEQAADYRWSSAASHLEGPGTPAGVSLDWKIWHQAGEAEGWRGLLGQSESLPEVIEMRRCTYSGKPFGPAEFIEQMEARFGRHWKDRGRPRKSSNPEKGTERSTSFFAS